MKTCSYCGKSYGSGDPVKGKFCSAECEAYRKIEECIVRLNDSLNEHDRKMLISHFDYLSNLPDSQLAIALKKLNLQSEVNDHLNMN